MNSLTSHDLAVLISTYQGFTRHEAFLWKKTAMSVLKLKIKYTKRHLTTLELRKLIRRKTPTNDVYQFIRNIESKNHKNRMMMVMMNQKLRNAIYVETLMRRQFSRCHEYFLRRWGGNHRGITSRFHILMQRQISFTWGDIRPKVLSKVEFLAQKYHINQVKPPDIIEDILISDEKLEEKFGQMEKAPPPVYGGV